MSLGRALALVLLTAACGDSGPDDSAPPPDSQAAPSGSTELPLEQDFRRLEFVAPAYRVHRERGVGVAHLRLDETGLLRVDTISVLTRPEEGAPTAARLIRSDMGVYALEVRTPVSEGGGLEYGYEDIGLPLLEGPAATQASAWLHVLFALSPDSTPLAGWVRNDTSRVSYFSWSDRLPESPLFFLDADSIAFHGSPDGPRVAVELVHDDGTARFDYIMHSLETRGPWMRAEVVSPSDYCFDPPAPRRDTLWIRYLDPGGRPRVWYYTRGC